MRHLRIHPFPGAGAALYVVEALCTRTERRGRRHDEVSAFHECSALSQIPQPGHYGFTVVWRTEHTRQLTSTIPFHVKR